MPLADGLEIAITTASPRILGELELLAELDRRHSVTVRLLIPVPVFLDPGPRLRAAHSLAAEGITTVLLLAPTATAREEEMRFFLEAAREAEVHDVEIETAPLRRADRTALQDTFRRLRLEYGFPRASAGRGRRPVLTPADPPRSRAPRSGISRSRSAAASAQGSAGPSAC